MEIGCHGVRRSKNVGNHCPRQWLSIYRAVNRPCLMKNKTKCKLYGSGTLATEVLACIREFANLYPQKVFVGKAYRVYSLRFYILLF